MPRKRKKKSRQSRQREMSALVSQYESGFEPLRSFCDRHGIAISTFRYWLEKYGTASESTPSGPSDFVAVQVRKTGPSVVAPNPFPEPAGHLIYPDGTELRLGPGVSPEFLRSLLPIFQAR